MKKIILIFIIWHLILAAAGIIAPKVLPLRTGFLGEIGWDNMDGTHYVSIAKNGYFQYEQAFFPGYPLLLKYLNRGLGINLSLLGFVVSNLFIFLSSIMLFKLIKAKFSEKSTVWSVVFLFFFPSPFFFSAVYTESFFLFLILASFYFAGKQKWLLAGLFGAIASLTRLAGIFLFPALLVEWWFLNKKNINPQPATRNSLTSQLFCICLIPLGLIIYMYYLFTTTGDPLFFFHAQPAFGAGRSGDKIILLPQVIYRYLKIFLTADLSYTYLISLFEFFSLFFVSYLLIKNIKKIPLSWQIFSWTSVLVPTLTGSLSSLPRYLISIFPLYLALSNKRKIVKIAFFIINTVLLFVGTMYFLRGYFVS